MKKLSQLLDQALTEIQARSDIQTLGNDAETETMMDQLPYESMAEIELQKEVNQAEVAEELLRRLQDDIVQMIAVYSTHFNRLKSKLDHPNFPPKDRARLTAQLKQNGRDMIRESYMVSGVSEATAQALAELQIP